MHVANDNLIEETEMRLLLNGVCECYGFDFRDYDPNWVRSRIWERVRAEQTQTVSGFQERVLHDPEVLERFLMALSVSRQGLFSDPAFYEAFRTIVVPILRTYPSLQLWHPASSSGEDVYSLAILLHEEGLIGRARIYATDFSEAAFHSARHGVFPAASIIESETAYREAGGKRTLESYYWVEGDRAILQPELKETIVFCEHNLATDDVFNEFQVIVARNILPVFNPWLQSRVHALFFKSLTRFGILCLGRTDSLVASESDEWYEALVPGMKLYRKIKATA